MGVTAHAWPMHEQIWRVTRLVILRRRSLCRKWAHAGAARLPVPIQTTPPTTSPGFHSFTSSSPASLSLAWCRAFRLLLADTSAPLIAIHRALVFREHDGLSLGPGPFVTALEVATGRRAEVVGKPEPAFFRAALDYLGCDPACAVMIGDSALDDVGGAHAVGARGVLVKTGKYRDGDESRHGVTPDAVVDDFGAAVDWVLRHTRTEGGGGGCR